MSRSTHYHSLCLDPPYHSLSIQNHKYKSCSIFMIRCPVVCVEGGVCLFVCLSASCLSACCLSVCCFSVCLRAVCLHVPIPLHCGSYFCYFNVLIISPLEQCSVTLLNHRFHMNNYFGLEPWVGYSHYQPHPHSCYIA
jgi:hypothetical protein